MAHVSSLMLARFTRLPRRSRDTWQGGVVRMPMWVDGPDGTPYRPRGGVWVSLETGVVNVKLAEEAGWQYGRALWAFRGEGDCPASRQRLRAAFRSNRHLPGYLAGESEWTDAAPRSYAMGSPEEAVICAGPCTRPRGHR